MIDCNGSRLCDGRQRKLKLLTENCQAAIAKPLLAASDINMMVLKIKNKETESN